MAEPHTIAIGGVVSDGWLTGNVHRWTTGERRATCETREVTCRVEDAGDELAELIAWLLTPKVVEPQLFL